MCRKNLRNRNIKLMVVFLSTKNGKKKKQKRFDDNELKFGTIVDPNTDERIISLKKRTDLDPKSLFVWDRNVETHALALTDTVKRYLMDFFFFKS